MTFYVQPRGGLTARLAARAAQQPGYTVPVLIDGAYGGIRGQPLRAYDRALVVACGSGAALALGPAMAAIADAAHQPRHQHHRLRILIATRDEQLVGWFEEALLAYMRETGAAWPGDDALRITVHVTGPRVAAVRGSSGSGSGSSSSSSSSIAAGAGQRGDGDIEKAGPVARAGQADATATGGGGGGAGSAPRELPIAVLSGRPDVAGAVRAATLEAGVSVALLACGPAGILSAVQAEAAAAQARIVRSEAGAREVYLHSELFS